MFRAQFSEFLNAGTNYFNKKRS